MRLLKLRASVLLAVALLAAQVSSCGGDEPTDGTTLDYELFETTHELDEATLAVLTTRGEDQSTLTFSASTPLLDSLAPGEVLFSGQTDATPQGMLVRVLAVDRSGAGVVVDTERTTAFHAFRRLNVELTSPLGVDSPMRIPAPPPRGPGAATEALTLSRSIGISDEPLELFDGDGRPGTGEDRVAGVGTLRAEVTIHFWLNFDWGDLSPSEAFDALDNLLDSLGDLLTGSAPTLAELIHLRTGISLEGEIEAAMQIDGKSTRHYSRPMALGTVPLGDLWVGPLLFKPALSLDAEFTGDVSGTMSLGYEIAADAKLGFEYDANAGLSPIVEGPSFTSDAPSPTVTVSAHLHGDLDLSLRFPLYGLLGPYVSIGTFIDAEIDRTREPCYRLTTGLQGKSGAWIGLGSFTLETIEGPSFPVGDPLLVASGACEPLPDPPVTDALITPWSRSYSDSAWSTGTDEDFTTLARAHDGRLLLTASTGRMLLKVDEDGTLTWARTFDQPDRPDFSRLDASLAVPTLDAGVLVATRQGVLVKLDAAGNGQWAAQLETDNDESGYFWSGKLIGDDIWLAGTRRLAGTTERQALLVVIGPDGYPKTAWLWGSPDYREMVRDILPLDDGVILVGESSTPGEARGFVMDVGFDGTPRWIRRVDPCADEGPVLATAIQTNDGDLIIGGWHYATETRAILFRIPRDGSGAAPQWVTQTTIDPILGLQPRSIHQLETGELRVTGRWGRIGNDAVFVAGTDSIGRFSWLRWYGGDRPQGPPTSVITSQGGLLVATSSATVEPAPGGFWLFEVPNPNGEITFRPDSDATSEPLVPTSTTGCLLLSDASLTTTPYPVGVTSVHVDVIEASPTVSDRAL